MVTEVLHAYLALPATVWWTRLALFAATLLLGGLAVVLGRRRAGQAAPTPPAWATWLRWVWLAAAVGVAVWLALRQASVVDDAFISFRYARNLAEGQGLVFNPGERVEGYTNFLWTLLLAGAYRLLPWELPLTALGMSLLGLVANLIVVHAISRRLAGEHRSEWHLPLAVALLALQDSVLEFGTTGLETSTASLLVDLGLYGLLVARRARGWFGAGLAFTLATLAHPDHLLFYGAAGLALLGMQAAPAVVALRRRDWPGLWQQGGRSLVALAAPALLLVAQLGWRLAYYGQTLPNTYYAKSADLPYWSQGLVYAALFWLGSQLWLLLPPFFGWTVRRGASARLTLFRRFSLISVGLYLLYVVRVGGDFMCGRFFVSLIPLLLLAVEEAVLDCGARVRAAWAAWRAVGATGGRPGAWLRPAVVGLLLAATMVATAHGERLLPPRQVRWNVANEGEFYRVRWEKPLRIDHYNYALAQEFRRVAAAGVRPVLATGAIGMVGWYSGLVLIDRYGLTDPTVARQTLRRRSRPGHEKQASNRYLQRRGVDFLSGPSPLTGELGALAELHVGRQTPRWHVLTYRRALVDAVRRANPAIRIAEIEPWLDRYLARLDQRSPERVKRDLAALRRFYFDANPPDPARLAPLERRAASAAAAAR